MSKAFSAMKKNRASMFDQLREQFIKDQNGPSFQQEDESMYWKPKTDKSGNGFAVIRFLPPPDGEVAPFVRLVSYGWQGPGGYYIEKSRKSISGEQADPCQEYLAALWRSGTEENKNLYRSRRARTQFISNILVIKDPANPDNEGRVMLFKYPKTIWNKIKEVMHPAENEYEPVEPRDPFDWDEGLNFTLRIKDKNGFPNYDDSKFGDPSPVADGDEKKQEQLWGQTYSLAEIIDESKFKSYDDLAKRLAKALGHNAPAAQEAAVDLPVARPKAEPKAEAKSSGIDFSSSFDDDEGVDDDLKFLQGLDD